MGTYRFVIFTLVLIVAILFVGKGFFQEKTKINDPYDSKVGEAIDQVTGLNQVVALDRAHNVADDAEMYQLQNAVVMYYSREGKYPETLGDLVDSRDIGIGALTDSYGRDYRIVWENGKCYLQAPGNTGIYGTSGNVSREVWGMEPPKPPTPKLEPTKSFFDLYPTPTRRCGPNTKGGN